MFDNPHTEIPHELQHEVLQRNFKHIYIRTQTFRLF